VGTVRLKSSVLIEVAGKVTPNGLYCRIERTIRELPEIKCTAQQYTHVVGRPVKPTRLVQPGELGVRAVQREHVFQPLDLGHHDSAYATCFTLIKSSEVNMRIRA
jgi:hypothetical protein